MPFRLFLAFALSLALHGSLLLPDIFKRQPVAPPRPALQALLRLPPVPETLEAPPAEPLLKNTIDPDRPLPDEKPAVTPPAETPRASPKRAAPREVKAAQRKLNEHLFYPAEAVAQGLEGEVRLILKLSDRGAVTEVSIAASSGHPILDNAAIKAAYAMGRLTGVTSGELILPVIFRLE